MEYIYLHGFASSPSSTKAMYLRDRFAELGIDLKTPDLNQGDFSHLSITRQINQIAAEFAGNSAVTLIGSSLGGLTATWLAEKYPQVQKLVLLAPAFEFLSHWLQQLGEEKLKQWQLEQNLMVYHYGEKRSLPLNYNFVLDAAKYQDQLLRDVPTLILHGVGDEVIPITASRNFARLHSGVKLVELNSDHALADVMVEIWQQIQVFCQLSSYPKN